MYRIVLFGGCQWWRPAGGWNLDVGLERGEWRGAGLALLSFGSCVVLNRARALAQVFYQPSSGDVQQQHGPLDLGRPPSAEHNFGIISTDGRAA